MVGKPPRVAALVLVIVAGCGGSSPPPPGDQGPGAEQGPALDSGTDGPRSDGPRVDGPGQSDTGLCGGQSCDDGLPCTDDLCQNGQCINTPKAGFCLIGAACHAAGDKQNPTGCAVCSPSASQSDWTDDASVCPDDGISCTTATCSAGVCSYPVQAGHCLVGDQCVQDGAASPTDPCQICDVNQSTSSFQPMPDGTGCPSDNLSCTDDVCQAGSCAHPVKADTCLIGGVCYLKGEANPFVACSACDPAASSTGWSTQADGSPCSDDALPCTYDICSAGTCTHTVKPGQCLIGNNCFSEGATNPAAECQHCAAATNATGWSTKPDGTLCTADTYSCTDDICTGGTCGHPLKDGHCLIAGTCYAEDAVVGSDGCTICASAISTIAGTFAAGKSCTDGSSATTMDTCVDSSCVGFVEGHWEWLSGDTDTVFNGVAYIPGSSATWAVGSYDDAGDVDGVIARLNGSGAPSNMVWAEQPFNSIHHRMAVGEAGQCRYYDGTSWVGAPTVEAHMGSSSSIFGVWGTSPNGIDRSFYLSASGSLLARCSTADNGANFTCVNQTGVSGAMIRVVGTTTAQSAQGPLWAVRGDSYEDIFYNSGAGTSWSTAGPTGCYDVSGAPCGDTTGRFLDLWAVSPSEVWAVGEAGLVMRFDGSGWSKLAIPTLTSPPQSSYVFRGVYADGDLVLLVGDRDFNGQYHDMIAVFYNRKLDRWFNPRLLFYTGATDPNKDAFRFHDVGGQAMSSVYLVGSIWTGTEQQALFMTPQ